MESVSDSLAPLGFLIPVGLTCAFATFLEWRFPRRQVSVPLGRWLSSMFLFLFAIFLGMLVLPIVGFAVARLSEGSNLGMMGKLALPVWLKTALTVLALDFIAFFSHWLFHRYRGLWRLHRVHHSDGIVSASTSLFHHPLEVLAVQLLGLCLIPILGLQAEGILIFTGLQYVFTIWQHANVASFPGQFWLGYLVFTPEEHRVHHSAERQHYNCNLGLIFTIWDRMFGTYVKERDLDQRIPYGLDRREWDYPDTIASLLIDPIRK